MEDTDNNNKNYGNKKEKGVIIDDYGNKYEGEMINGLANGKGKKTYKDG